MCVGIEFVALFIDLYDVAKRNVPEQAGFLQLRIGQAWEFFGLVFAEVADPAFSMSG